MILPDGFTSPDAHRRSVSADVIVPLADDGARDAGPPRSVRCSHGCGPA